MKQFMKIFAGVLVIMILVSSVVGCQNNNVIDSPSSTESVEESDKAQVTKKPYIPPVLPPETEEPEETEKPEIPEVTGPLPVETDTETGFSGAVDMH